jgi:hypothetical protein
MSSQSICHLTNSKQNVWRFANVDHCALRPAAAGRFAFPAQPAATARDRDPTLLASGRPARNLSAQQEILRRNGYALYHRIRQYRPRPGPGRPSNVTAARGRADDRHRRCVGPEWRVQRRDQLHSGSRARASRPCTRWPTTTKQRPPPASHRLPNRSHRSSCLRRRFSVALLEAAINSMDISNGLLIGRRYECLTPASRP